MATRKASNHLIGARQAKKRLKQSHGDIESLREVLWKFITRLKDHIDKQPEVDADCLRVGHALIQAGGLFIRTVESGEWEARLEKLENPDEHTDPAS